MCPENGFDSGHERGQRAHRTRLSGQPAKGPVWYAKYRLPDGRQVQKRLGPAWTDRGRPAAGNFTKRTAEAWLREVLVEARRGTLPGSVRSGATFADAAAEWLRFIEEDRERKPSTLRDYRSALKVHLLPAFGDRPLESITDDDIEAWRRSLPRELSNRMKNKLIIQLHGIFRRARSVWKLSANPVALIEKHPIRSSGGIEVFSPEEVWALVRAARDEIDSAIFLTAAFTGLRMGELLALCWRDVDFGGSTLRVRQNFAGGQLTTPKSGKVRSVPLAPDVATALARLGSREHWVDDDLVFASPVGSYISDAALRPRFKSALKRADLRDLRFHDLRHTFGTRMISQADIRRVQEWMGHADIQTTMKYLH
jgi:integrase